MTTAYIVKTGEHFLCAGEDGDLAWRQKER